MAKLTKADKDFQAQDDMRTLIEAEKIKRDKKRLSAATSKAKEQRAALSVVIDKKKEA